MAKLVLATHNKGKVIELSELLSGQGITIILAGDLGVSEPEETGDTFHANARLKALHSATATGQVALADDSGLCVAALGGAPGIYSARWGGEEKDFAKACEKIREQLAASGNQLNAQAHFTCVLSLAWPNGKSVEFEGRVHGTLTFPARGQQGFGYDPIFVPTHSTKTYGEMTAAEKNARNHRQDAFEKFVAWLGENNINNT